MGGKQSPSGYKCESILSSSTYILKKRYYISDIDQTGEYVHQPSVATRNKELYESIKCTKV